ncbi:MAG: glycosyltransferase [Bacteriovoracaceae bacterium]|jgi:glycosyltransferase involved in cell wall biosynthesis|nr:glycosyltransferase [Bacteriovoracaceae bacterium]
MKWPVKSETFCVRDILALKKIGHTVTVLSLLTEDKDSSSIKKNMGGSSIPSKSLTLYRLVLGLVYSLLNIKIFLSLFYYLFRNEKKVMHLLKSVLLIPSTFWCLSEIEKEKPEVVHLFWGHYPSMLGYCLRRKRINTKLSMFLGAYDLATQYALSSEVSKEADYLFTHAKENLKELKKRDFRTSRFNVVYRGLDLDALKLEKINKNRYQITIVSRLIKEKNIQSVIEAFKLVKKEQEEAKLFIIGEGDYRDELELLVKRYSLNKSVLFLGYKTQKFIFDFLSRSNLFILLSYKKGECLPNSVKEAMLLGCIPLVSKTPGIDELITNGETGFIVENQSRSAIASLILELFEKNLEDIRIKAKHKVESEFDVMKSMQKYSNIWFK